VALLRGDGVPPGDRRHRALSRRRCGGRSATSWFGAVRTVVDTDLPYALALGANITDDVGNIIACFVKE
jgi:hypothetical protein